MLTDSEAAELALLILYAMDQYEHEPAALAPAPDPRIAASGWELIGYLTAVDSLNLPLPVAPVRQGACYGYLAQSTTMPDVYVAAIRGTADVLEWIEDAEFFQIHHPAVGNVEAGFWSIYQSLTYRPVAGGAAAAAQGVAAAVGATGSLTVLGHSLGAPLAAYLSFDLAADALLGQRVRAAMFASPRPGDAAFANGYDARVRQYQIWNYELDVVPRVPRGFDYTDLPKVNWIGIERAKAQICFTLACHHHITSYAAMLDFDALDWGALPLIDSPFVACIKGPA